MGVAWSTAGRLLQPVRRVTDTARSISETDLSRRIPVESGDEVGELARTFNQMLERLEVGSPNQRSFVDDAGHELRTPITGDQLRDAQLPDPRSGLDGSRVPDDSRYPMLRTVSMTPRSPHHARSRR